MPLSRWTTSRPHCEIAAQHHFRIGVRPELMAQLFEFAPQLAEVVDFAVVGEPHAAALVTHRLPPEATEVQNGQPPMTQHQARRHEQATAVRSAMPQRLGHRQADGLAAGRAGRTTVVKDPRDSTHVVRASRRAVLLQASRPNAVIAIIS